MRTYNLFPPFIPFVFLPFSSPHMRHCALLAAAVVLAACVRHTTSFIPAIGRSLSPLRHAADGCFGPAPGGHSVSTAEDAGGPLPGGARGCVAAALKMMSEARRKAREAAELPRDPLHNETRVIVVGGGIGGLATALACAKRGFQVTVLEKDESFLARRQGYGLTLQQGGGALTLLGVAKAVEAEATWSQSHFVFDSVGDIVAFWGPTWWERAREEWAAGLPPGEQGAKRGKEEWRKLAGHNLHIPRQSLRQILLRALLEEQEDAVVWGADVLNVKEVDAAEASPRETGIQGRHVAITLQDGRRFVGHCCVACDGIHSKIRPLLLPQPAPLRYLGYIVVLGIFPIAKYPLCRKRCFQTSDGKVVALPANPSP